MSVRMACSSPTVLITKKTKLRFQIPTKRFLSLNIHRRPNFQKAKEGIEIPVNVIFLHTKCFHTIPCVGLAWCGCLFKFLIYRGIKTNPVPHWKLKASQSHKKMKNLEALRCGAEGKVKVKRSLLVWAASLSSPRLIVWSGYLDRQVRH